MNKKLRNNGIHKSIFQLLSKKWYIQVVFQFFFLRKKNKAINAVHSLYFFWKK